MSEKIIFHNGTLDEIDGKLVQVGCKYTDCGKVSFPQSERCMFCGSDHYEKVPLIDEGIVFSYSVTEVPVGNFKPPIIGAFIDLPDGTRVYGQIHGNADEIKVGMKVKAKTGVLWTEKDETEVLGYYYVPVADGGAR